LLLCSSSCHQTFHLPISQQTDYFKQNHSKKMTYSSPRQHRSHSFSFYFISAFWKLVSLYEFEGIIDWKHGWKSLEIYFVRFISL
jgi:hypothetical protein